MTKFQPKLEILPEAQRAIWPLLTPACQMEFTLYGGTAIALQLGHRTSIDFDFFSSQSFRSEQVRSTFPFLNECRVEQELENTFTVITKDGVKLSFFGNISFGRVAQPIVTNDNNIQIASLDDLMATKLKVLFNRIEYKDYTDIATMLKHGVELAKGLASAKAMFGDNFQPGEALKAMTYFEGGDLKKLSSQDKEILVNAARHVGSLPTARIISKSLYEGSARDTGA